MIVKGMSSTRRPRTSTARNKHNAANAKAPERVRPRALAHAGREGRQQRWMAAAIVNATGIQSDAIRQLADPSASPRMLTSRGSHLVIAEDLCPEGVGLLVPSTADGRVLFMLPFFGRTLVGTTDQPCDKDGATHPSKVEEG